MTINKKKCFGKANKCTKEKYIKCDCKEKCIDNWVDVKSANYNYKDVIKKDK
jgi:hypothetical protein